MLGILLPTRHRIKFVSRCLESLARSMHTDLLEVVVICDADYDSYLSLCNFSEQSQFGSYNVFFSDMRLYSVAAFNLALSRCDSEMFCWITDISLFISKNWIMYVKHFFSRNFSDGIGVMSLIEEGGAKIGVTTKSFVRYNEGEWFYPGYKIHYPDVELTHRAMLLGKYTWTNESLIFHDKTVKHANLAISPTDRYQFILKDKELFRERQARLFDLPGKKIVFHDHDFMSFKKVVL